MRVNEKEEKIKKREWLLNDSAAKIQGMVRGVLYRKRHIQLLPALKRAKQVRGFCVECENKVARRRCRQCRDNFCEACYEKLHKKGT